MSDAILDLVAAAAERHGACEPKWLVQRKEPKFKAVVYGTTGPHVILLHGLLGAVSNWDSTIPLLAKFCRPISFGFPLLSGHRSEVKVKALAAFTEYYIRQNNLGPVILCGNSLGGHVAMRLCLASPELVDCLVLSATSGLYEHSVDTLPIRIGEKFVREHMEKVFFNHEFVTQEAIDEIVKILSSRMNTLNLIHAARSAKKDNLRDRLPEITVPTLLPWGEDDTVTTMQVARQFEQYIPNSELVTIKNCGHAPMIEHPQWFADQVEGFLKKHSRYYRSEKK
ncbi:MAG: alpha/beta hydrolase [Bdellovibrionales bacterium]|nr:alpha/beta hydrolase [Bdellovibrionales bacterium]